MRNPSAESEFRGHSDEEKEQQINGSWRPIWSSTQSSKQSSWPWWPRNVPVFTRILTIPGCGFIELRFCAAIRLTLALPKFVAAQIMFESGDRTLMPPSVVEVLRLPTTRSGSRTANSATPSTFAP